MSQGGSPKQQELQFRKLLLERAKVLDAKPGQVILIEMPAEFFARRDTEQMALAQTFARQLGEAAHRDVFLVKEGTVHPVDDPRPKQPASPLQVARKQILLPAGVKLDG